ncbi:hypothetical protein SAMN05892877_1386 [Rhizobium subbaraonis]|uniref:Uncharacterized protein n=1 Tax=Rhizobium subbaraonis TaxID=908946 RepID=A0A285V206_9HYPH|nr:hypothetical protein SAMN05892877_1386 [Rhizobium subbaraonis]
MSPERSKLPWIWVVKPPRVVPPPGLFAPFCSGRRDSREQWSNRTSESGAPMGAKVSKKASTRRPCSADRSAPRPSSICSDRRDAGGLGISIRWACKVLRFDTSTYHYKSRRTGQAPLERRIKEYVRHACGMATAVRMVTCAAMDGRSTINMKMRRFRLFIDRCCLYVADSPKKLQILLQINSSECRSADVAFVHFKRSIHTAMQTLSGESSGLYQCFLRADTDYILPRDIYQRTRSPL